MAGSTCARLCCGCSDLYLQRPTHTPEDERYYTELALRLIDATDTSQRAALAARLATYHSAPRQVLLRLANDVVEVAAPILEHSPGLTPADLSAIAERHGAAHADIIAKRPPVAPPAVQTAGPRTDSSAKAEASELSELFYSAAASERRLILINLDYAAPAPLPAPSGLQRADVWRLESATLQHNTEIVLRELERTLGLARTQTRRIVDDELGEPIVVAAKALEVPTDVLQRMLLFINPRVGQSVERVYELAEALRRDQRGRGAPAGRHLARCRCRREPAGSPRAGRLAHGGRKRPAGPLPRFRAGLSCSTRPGRGRGNER